MRKSTWLTAAFGTVLLAAPALAQMQPYGAPGRSDSLTEMERERRNSGPPSVPMQNRDGAVADDIDARGVQDWLMQAKAAIGRGNLGQANEFLERAETRLLSRSTEPSRAGTPAAGPRISSISSAREALRKRDRQEAMRQIEMALRGA
ncbi:hypothetical protein EJV46_19140 [Roseococcus sp. SYP-B2431]|uniref:hypothetical protein n=1 Tax=Roseococcus sp. SYP-B2431 TaxID=2496640 RepID=UPI00103D6FEA|nr:hypothetical protein [Roseococcus sp. SYP-B2431]TCH96698.1 hypothetical protein EJV46_19140 [Roseococcus sp. SYP-B2431]